MKPTLIVPLLGLCVLMTSAQFFPNLGNTNNGFGPQPPGFSPTPNRNVAPTNGNNGFSNLFGSIFDSDQGRAFLQSLNNTVNSAITNNTNSNGDAIPLRGTEDRTIRSGNSTTSGTQVVDSNLASQDLNDRINGVTSSQSFNETMGTLNNFLSSLFNRNNNNNNPGNTVNNNPNILPPNNNVFIPGR